MDLQENLMTSWIMTGHMTSWIITGHMTSWIMTDHMTSWVMTGHLLNVGLVPLVPLLPVGIMLDKNTHDTALTSAAHCGLESGVGEGDHIPRSLKDVLSLRA